MDQNRRATVAHMIDVMTHFLNGGEVEYSNKVIPTHWGPAATPVWDWNSFNYRKAVRTIDINGFKVPEPMREEPKKGSHYFIVAPLTNAPTWVRKYQWDNQEFERRWLSLGLIHETQEAAELHAEALLSFTSKVPIDSEVKS